MKTILLIISVYLLPISLFGQTDVRESDSYPLLKSTNGVKLRLDSIRPIPPSHVYGTFSYDSNGKNITSSDLTIIYDSVGNLITIKYEDKILEEYTYTSKGEILTSVSYNTVNNGPWSPIYKSNYIYDTNQNKTTMYLYSAINGWDVGPEIWTSYYIGSYIQLMYGAVCETEECIDTKVEFNYDTNWNLTSKIVYFRWDMTKPWEEMQRVEYLYDTYDNLIRVISGGRKSEFKYDNSFSFKDLYLPYMYYRLFNTYYWVWETDFINHKRTEQTDYSYDNVLGQWIEGTTYKYYYSEHTITGIEETSQEELLVYPNPSKDHIIFDINTHNEPSVVELYDSQGRIVLNEEIQQDKRIQVKHLYRGLYIYRLNYQNTIKTGKVILQ